MYSHPGTADHLDRGTFCRLEADVTPWRLMHEHLRSSVEESPLNDQ